MKDKIMSALKTKYKNLGLGDKAFDGVAEFLKNTVTEESAIETAISGVEGILKNFQSELDTVRGEKSNLQKKLADYEGNKLKNESSSDDAPDWFKQYKSENEDLLAKVIEQNKNLFELHAKNKQDQIISKLVKDLDIPEWRMVGMKIDENMKEEDIFNLLTEVKQSIVSAGIPAKQGGFQVTNDNAIIQQEKEFVASLPDKN